MKNLCTCQSIEFFISTHISNVHHLYLIGNSCFVVTFQWILSSGYLRGVEIIDTTYFTYTGRAKSLEWKGFGFRMHLPENALPPGVNECQIQIKASLSGQFKFPEDTELLSSIYWITCPHKFAKAVTVEIQHCICAMESEYPQHSSSLTFIVAQCTQEDLPYQFKILDGGVFSPSSQYGRLDTLLWCWSSLSISEAVAWS